MSQEAHTLAALAPKIMNAFHDLGAQHPKGERLSMRQFQALIILNASQKLTLSQLCEKLSLAPSTGTELIDRMIALDYILKAHEDRDHRRVLLSVAPKGLELLKQRQLALSEMFSKFLADFSAEDGKRFVRDFEDIWKLIQKYHIQSR